MVTPELEPIQIASEVFLVLSLLVEILQIKRKPKNFLWFVPVMSAMIHSIIFYACLFLENYGHININVSYTIWSSIRVLNIYVAIFVTEASRWFIGSSIYLKVLNRYYKKGEKWIL